MGSVRQKLQDFSLRSKWQGFQGI